MLGAAGKRSPFSAAYKWMPMVIWRKLLRQAARFAEALARERDGSKSAARIAMTTSSSMRVKPMILSLKMISELRRSDEGRNPSPPPLIPPRSLILRERGGRCNIGVGTRGGGRDSVGTLPRANFLCPSRALKWFGQGIEEIREKWVVCEENF